MMRPFAGVDYPRSVTDAQPAYQTHNAFNPADTFLRDEEEKVDHEDIDKYNDTAAYYQSATFGEL